MPLGGSGMFGDHMPGGASGAGAGGGAGGPGGLTKKDLEETMKAMLAPPGASVSGLGVGGSAGGSCVLVGSVRVCAALAKKGRPWRLCWHPPARVEECCAVS